MRQENGHTILYIGSSQCLDCFMNPCEATQIPTQSMKSAIPK